MRLRPPFTIVFTIYFVPCRFPPMFAPMPDGLYAPSCAARWRGRPRGPGRGRWYGRCDEAV